MKHFAWSNKPIATTKVILREGGLPILGIMGITVGLVGIFYLCLTLGAGMEPVIPIHVDDGETVDPNPMRMAFMLTGFVIAFVLAQYTRAYLRHLFVAGEILGPMIASLHNIGFYLWLVREARKHIMEGDFTEWRDMMLKKVT